ncbi:hypothetical protein [Bdellovibrio sp. NC01]|uniref:hypothetical protein n=1 Tax=Bdellovibrio sp. NC01 TaxID=2220073 RepID=UPI0011581D4A|nr:hypothetical protein [Bdellovibrio sp. NC01]QDK37198.1 hypothetical protein DOE51_06145 [Bdellovibrio sp. NC01]
MDTINEKKQNKVLRKREIDWVEAGMQVAILIGTGAAMALGGSLANACVNKVTSGLKPSRPLPDNVVELKKTVNG